MLFSAKVEQEIRPMNELSDKRIEDLDRDVIAVMVKARGDERGKACCFIRTLP